MLFLFCSTQEMTCGALFFPQTSKGDVELMYHLVEQLVAATDVKVFFAELSVELGDI